VHVVGHLPQGTLGDVLPIHRTHVRRGGHVTHNVVDRHLVAGLRADGLERSPQSVEAKALQAHAGLLHSLLHRVGNGVVQNDVRLPVARSVVLLSCEREPHPRREQQRLR
jgi:hypothetical protein